VPGAGNWTVRAGVRSRRAIRRLQRERPLDALFVHTQVPAIGVPDLVRKIPTVVSLDATPIQYDELGEHYGHASGHPRVEELKWRANRACFRRAAALVSWAAWTKTGLVERYEVPAEKVTVIPPGVDVARWSTVGGPRVDGPLRVLFVGGDLVRKGGDILIEAARRLRHEGLAIHVDLVTRDAAPDEPGISIHRGLGPNTPELIERYHEADVFCLPTLGDCLPMVLSEAGAVGLPLVSTDVGAISEIVRDGETGLIVPAGDADALTAALRRLATDRDLGRRLGAGAQALVRAEYDAASNARRLVELLVAVSRDRVAA
jgi:glycosyltransferase involved in cell wall biosynthesis